MKKILILAALLSLLIACNYFGAVNPAEKSSVSTQVSEQLTASPIVISTDAPQVIDSTPTEIVIPTETETPLPTITETPTLSPGDPRIKLGNPNWKETFDKVNQNFYQYDDNLINFKYENGALVMTAKIPMGGTYWSMSYPRPKNAYLEATFKTGTCSGDDRYGMIFRAPNFEDGYFFGITCDGKYSLRIYSQKGYLIPLTANPAINAGSNQVNRVGILIQDDRYAFYVNGKLLQETRESTFLEAGLFGAYISSANTANFTVTMDEIDLWNK